MMHSRSLGTRGRTRKHCKACVVIVIPVWQMKAPLPVKYRIKETFKSLTLWAKLYVGHLRQKWGFETWTWLRWDLIDFRLDSLKTWKQKCRVLTKFLFEELLAGCLKRQAANSPSTEYKDSSRPCVVTWLKYVLLGPCTERMCSVI